MREHANADTPTSLIMSLCAYTCSRVFATVRVYFMRMSTSVTGHMYCKCRCTRLHRIPRIVRRCVVLRRVHVYVHVCVCVHVCVYAPTKEVELYKH